MNDKLAAFRARNPGFKSAGYFQNVVGFDDVDNFGHERSIAAEHKVRAKNQEWDSKFDAANPDKRMSSFVHQDIRRKRSPHERFSSAAAGAGAGLLAGIAPSVLRGRPSSGRLGAAGAAAGALIGAFRPGKKEERYIKNPNFDRSAFDEFVSQNPRPERDELDHMEGRWNTYGPKGGEDFGHMGKYTEIPEMVFGRSSAMLSDRDTGKGYLTRDELVEARNMWEGIGDEYTVAVLDKALASGRKFFTSSNAG